MLIRWSLEYHFVVNFSIPLFIFDFFVSTELTFTINGESFQKKPMEKGYLGNFLGFGNIMDLAMEELPSFLFCSLLEFTRFE
jgi:hypothetical protein